MRSLLWMAGIGALVGGCATNAPQLAWGKAGVTRFDYGTDVGTCTGLASTQNSGSNGANSAGGISGSNASSNSAMGAGNRPSGSAVAGSAAATGGASTGAVSAPTPAGGTYSGMASADYAQRAATQQRTQEMADQRARSEALRSCLADRGYNQFALTGEQRAKLAALKKGSAEYHEYLYQLGSDPQVIATQSRVPAK